MSETTIKYLKNARAARAEGNTEDAKRFYDMVRTDDPDNIEAKFFYQYYCLYEGKNGEIPGRFRNIMKVLGPTVRAIASWETTEEEKMELLGEIVNAFTPLTWTLNRYMNSLTVGSGQNTQRVIPANEIKNACEAGVVALYNLGDNIAQTFGNSPAAMQIAVVAWKEGVTLQQKWYAYKYEGKTAEEYAEKIKKVDPAYEMPKKAGCISFADKR